MVDIVGRARFFATEAHARIDHRRKYTEQPYDAHLAAVARLVASVSDDPEMIAAAWLHDTVEDTPATIEDIEAEFGEAVAGMVAELTDVSRPSDGNRAARKELDRQHLARASVRAKTIKLADLINNCAEITKHDPRFARVFLQEMAALLEVLSDGNANLYRRAQRTHARCLERLRKVDEERDASTLVTTGVGAALEPSQHHVSRLFVEAFSARDIAKPLRSFDAERNASQVLGTMNELHLDVSGIRIAGVVQGYLRSGDVSRGICHDRMRAFAVGQIVSGDSPLSDVIQVLTRHEHCFVTLLGEASGVISRNDINSPVVRMWLFGVITIAEMALVRRIRVDFANDSWRDKLSRNRLAKALAVFEERRRRNQSCELLDCLQLSDKAQILIQDEDVLEWMGVVSKRVAKQRIRELESLRNNLAHAQDIVVHDWAQIARMAHRIEEVVVLGETDSRPFVSQPQ